MISIIGGGPTGCYAASLLAKNNDVNIYERKSVIGKPIQCTGILTHTVNEILKPKKDFITNKIYSTRIYAPNNEFLEIKFKQPNIVVHRDLFDQHFLDKALKNGAKIVYNKMLIGKNLIEDRRNKRKTKIVSEKIIGADGPLSNTSEIYGFGRRKYLMGVQALIKKKNDNIIDFFPYIGTYAWAVPENENTLRVGVAAQSNTLKIFKSFSKRYKGTILEWQGGIIPLHDPKLRIEKENVFLLGDAAGQIKNTTGGGLVPGLMAAEELTKAIDEKKSYKKLCDKRIGRSLWMHYLARKVMNKFNEKEWNELIKICETNSVKELLSKESRDKPISLILKTIVKNPKILKYSTKLM